MNASREEPARGQILFALASVAALVTAILWLDQTGAKVPTTWKDPSWTFRAFLEAAQKTTTRQGSSASRWGADVSGATARRDWQPWVWNNGGDLFNADGT